MSHRFVYLIDHPPSHRHGALEAATELMLIMNIVSGKHQIISEKYPVKRLSNDFLSIFLITDHGLLPPDDPVVAAIIIHDVVTSMSQ